jgi:phytoene dehydrogenase-like protein
VTGSAVVTHAVVVGAGPNGLAAAIAMARAGHSVTVFEAADKVGGGSRTQQLTLPGFRHDVCSAVHPLAASSPFFASLPLADHGLEWVQPDIPLAHPFDDGTAVVLYRSLDQTARGLGPDGPAYRRLVEPLAGSWAQLVPQVMGPVVRRPRHPLLMARFGLQALRSATSLATRSFCEPRTRALFAGLAAHAQLPLDRRFTASFGLVLAAAAHASGWPVARGGSQSIVDALASYLQSLGGQIVTGSRVTSLDELPAPDLVLLDLTPRQVCWIAGPRLPSRYQKALSRFRYGPAVFKIDLALDGPIPWTAADCRRAGTVHIGPTLEDIVASEAAIDRGEHSERPYVLVAQQSLFDETRAPAGKHTAWAYCHVPHGSKADMTEPILTQIERFAPGFRDRILACHVMSPAALEAYNENYVGGDIAGGSHGGLQLFFRPNRSLRPYVTPVKGLYICSSSTPPGAGVHGMCGYHAAQAALSH